MTFASAADLSNPDLLQRRMEAALETADLIAALHQRAAQRLAEKTTTTGDQDFHV